MEAEMTARKGAAAMRSPVGWALLGLVIERPSYGYELMQRFERTYGNVLELSSPSQIYVALDTLGRKGLIEELPPEGPAAAVVRQPKPHYRATAAGLRGYQEWLIAQMRSERRRTRLFARQLAALEPGAALATIERYEYACLQEAREAPAGGGREPAVAADGGEEPAHAAGAAGLAARLVCEEERLAVGARLAWVEYARREFTALEGGRTAGGVRAAHDLGPAALDRGRAAPDGGRAALGGRRAARR
jgi:DNA-binding PadR family transcriptional regulator